MTFSNKVLDLVNRLTVWYEHLGPYWISDLCYTLEGKMACSPYLGQFHLL